MTQKETDPTGRKNSDPGAKVDSGKLDYTLVPTSSFKWLAKLWGVGAKKYSRDGWKEVPDGQARYLAALYRHLEEMRSGEWMDSDTGCPHLICVAWNALVVVWLKENNKG